MGDVYKHQVIPANAEAADAKPFSEIAGVERAVLGPVSGEFRERGSGRVIAGAKASSHDTLTLGDTTETLAAWQALGRVRPGAQGGFELVGSAKPGDSRNDGELPGEFKEADESTPESREAAERKAIEQAEGWTREDYASRSVVKGLAQTIGSDEHVEAVFGAVLANNDITPLAKTIGQARGIEPEIVANHIGEVVSSLHDTAMRGLKMDPQTYSEFQRWGDSDQSKADTIREAVHKFVSSGDLRGIRALAKQFRTQSAHSGVSDSPDMEQALSDAGVNVWRTRQGLRASLDGVDALVSDHIKAGRLVVSGKSSRR